MGSYKGLDLITSKYLLWILLQLKVQRTTTLTQCLSCTP